MLLTVIADGWTVPAMVTLPGTTATPLPALSSKRTPSPSVYVVEPAQFAVVVFQAVESPPVHASMPTTLRTSSLLPPVVILAMLAMLVPAPLIVNVIGVNPVMAPEAKMRG